MIVYAINALSVRGFIKFAIDSEEVAEIVEIVIEAIGIIVIIQSYLNPVINPTFVNITSLFLPLPAFNWIILLGTIASNKGI